jgi:predicted O-linked N-acetylglucosamine transferase (SPINDLY family)
VGLTEFIARDRDDYVAIATRLAHDLPRLSDLRVSLRGQVAASPLCNYAQFAENFLNLLRRVRTAA